MKLNLGSGLDRKEGYINVDILQPAELQHDLRQPLPYEDESIDEIYCRDLINHFSRFEWEHIKKDWVRVLKKEGIIHLIVRDLDYVVRQFLESKDNIYKWGWWIQCIYAGQDNEYDFFKNGFNQEKLILDMKEEGVTVLKVDTSDPNFINVTFQKL